MNQRNLRGVAKQLDLRDRLLEPFQVLLAKWIIFPAIRRNTAIAMDRISMNSSANSLTGILREPMAHEIVAILHRALARAELNAPAGARGAFIGVGAAFDAFQAIGKVLKEATKEVLFIDAYMDSAVLTNFATLAPEGVAIHVLGDSFSSKPALLCPAAELWKKQFDKRPLEVRLSAPRALHDRLIIVDGGAKVWNLSQSFNHLVARSPASLVRLDDDIARQKRDYYLPVWSASSPL